MSPSTPTPLPPGPERLRRFLDADNVQWAAWEVEIAYVAENAARLTYLAPELAAGWVAFESERGERRRLAPIPEGWYEADERGLLGLLERADVVRERRTPLHPPPVDPSSEGRAPTRGPGADPGVDRNDA